MRIDDDVAGFTVTESGATSVSEAGTTDNFTVELDAEPSTDVVIAVTSADTGEATVSPDTLTFTTGHLLRSAVSTLGHPDFFKHFRGPLTICCIRFTTF